MHKIQVKPLSLNSAYRGRRFTTPELKQFKQEVFYLLPKITVPEGKLKVKYIFGVSSKNSDVDNCIKTFQDVIADTYNFNDKLIYQVHVNKEDVEKGEEYISFEIEQF